MQKEYMITFKIPAKADDFTAANDIAKQLCASSVIEGATYSIEEIATETTTAQAA